MTENCERHPKSFWAWTSIPLAAGVAAWVAVNVYKYGLPFSPFALDFDVYVNAGRTVLAGGDLYSTEAGALPFIYPPIAALLVTPTALGPQLLWQVVWLILQIAAIIAVVHRCGLTGWRMAAVSTLALVTCMPVLTSTLLGQVGIFLTAAVILDLLPGPTILPRRFLPAGWLTGLAAAIKLTPALFIPFLFITRRRREALIAVTSASVATAVGFAFFPAQSWAYWRQTLNPEGFGFNLGSVYLANQSIIGIFKRTAPYNEAEATAGIAMAALFALLSLLVARKAALAGFDLLSLSLVGVGTLMASPISWTHHYIWIVPLAVQLLRRELPRSIQIRGTLFALWYWVTPYNLLPKGGLVELDYTWQQNAFGAFGLVLGAALLISVAATNLPPRPSSITDQPGEISPSKSS